MQKAAPSNRVDLSIVIVNWHSAGLLRQCLRSLYQTVSDVRSEIIVIDNASYDGSAELLASEFPLVRFLQSTENLGFAKANNLACEKAVGRNILFLNPDTEVKEGAVQRLLSCVDSMPGAGAVGPRLLNSDGSVQVTCLQAFPSILNQVFGAALLQRWFPKWSIWGNRALFRNSHTPVPVEGIVGACLMINRDLFQRVGGFNSQYFMYAEDIDLCYVLMKRGRTNYYVGSATVVHHGGLSSKVQTDPDFSTIVMRKSVLCFMRLHRGRLYAEAFRASTAAAAVCRIWLLAASLLVSAGVDRRRRLKSAFRKWVRVFCWAISPESRSPMLKRASL